MFFKNEMEKRRYIKERLKKIEKARYAQVTLLAAFCLITSVKIDLLFVLAIPVAIAEIVMNFYALSYSNCPICGRFFNRKYIFYPESCHKCGEIFK